MSFRCEIYVSGTVRLIMVRYRFEPFFYCLNILHILIGIVGILVAWIRRRFLDTEVDG